MRRAKVMTNSQRAMAAGSAEIAQRTAGHAERLLVARLACLFHFPALKHCLEPGRSGKPPPSH